MYTEKVLTWLIPQKRYEKFLLPTAVVVCLVFFVAYSLLSVVRHNNYQSFGYDLGINDQVIWRYSTFQPPLTTSDPFPYHTKLVAHVELIYVLISPTYWIWSDARMLLLVEVAFLCASGIAVFLLARRKKIHGLISLALLISYLGFYGIQNAVWFDVHSASFAAAFLMWFIYFLDSKKIRLAAVFLILAVTAKENIGLLTFLISFAYFMHRRDRFLLLFMAISTLYLLFIYLVYFPHIVDQRYLYQNSGGLLSNLNPLSYIDSPDKRQAILYSFASFGFVPLLAPLYLLPVAGDLGTYFVLASELEASHGLFMHYRVTLAPLLVLATIAAVSRFRKLNTPLIALYFLFCTAFVQYTLHLPLSYLTKSWFWTEPSGVKHINAIKRELPSDASVVAQNNILPHLSHRDKIYTLYPEKKKFSTNSPCAASECDWFRWDGSPRFLIIDTSPEWDARHYLTDREKFTGGLENLEKTGTIKPIKTVGTAVVYEVLQNPALP